MAFLRMGNSVVAKMKAVAGEYFFAGAVAKIQIFCSLNNLSFTFFME